MKYTAPLLAFALVGALASCSDDTATLGTGVLPGFDKIATSQATYSVTSRSIKMDSVLANTSTCYLGSIVDPESHATTSCNFLAQYHMRENYSFPAKNRMVSVDSCDIRLYFKTYYGDSLTTMKLYVQELDTNKIMKEGAHYYTTINPAQYVSTTSPYQKTITYSVRDLTGRDLRTSADSFKGSVVVRLPKEYAQYIVNKYYENPAYFKNSYSFIHHVCPGFYFKTSDGVGSMLKVETSYLNLYFRYLQKTATGRDSICSGQESMAATEEVIQNTHVDNQLPTGMLSATNQYSYVKSPVGIYTEVALPVDDIVGGNHYTDSINQAKITFRCLDNTTSGNYTLTKPSTLILLPKSEMYSFFETKTLPDNLTSYTADYNSDFNAYVFNNIGQLLSAMKRARDKGAGVVVGESEASRRVKYAAWESVNPNWNKVALLPVSSEYTTVKNNLTGETTRQLLRVRNELGLSSVKLQGGPTGNNLSISVVYTKFEK